MQDTENFVGVYILKRSDGMIKIGKTGSLFRRISDLSKSTRLNFSVIASYECDKRNSHKIERTAQALLVSKNVYSEWFNASDAEAIGAVEQAIHMVANGDVLPKLRIFATKPAKLAEGKKPQLNVRLTEDERHALEAAARSVYRPSSALVRKVANEWLMANGWL